MNQLRSETHYKMRMRFPIGRSYAEIIKRSLDPENYVYIKVEVDGDDLVLECSSKSAGSLLHTIDDFFWCFSVAYNILLEIHRADSDNIS